MGPPTLFDQADRVEISVTFTYDLPLAEQLAAAWRHVAPVEVGGPATGMPGGNFQPGRYLKRGYVITSRGCPNRCWFCSVWRREGPQVRTLPIRDGYNVLDDNLLACPEDHIRRVFTMLAAQRERPQFTGGLEAARLQDWHVDLLVKSRVKQAFFAYDTAADWEPLREAAKHLMSAIPPERKTWRCYVLIGHPQDTIAAAVARLVAVSRLGFMPCAMLYRDSEGRVDNEWKRFQRTWANPTICAANWAKARAASDWR